MGDRETSAALEEVLGLSVLDGVLEHGAAAEAAALEDEDGSGRSGHEAGVVVHVQPGGVDDSRGDAVEVDDDCGWVVCGVVVATALVVSLLLVARGQERRRLVGTEEREVEGAGHRPLVRGHVQPAGVEREVGGGEEVEVLAGLVPHRRDGVGHAVGELARVTGLRVVDEDRAQLVVQPPGVRNPPRIGGPYRVHGALRVREAVGVDVVHLAGLDLEHQHAVVGVGEGQPGSVRRPFGPEVERRLGDLDSTLVRTVLRGDHQPVLVAVVVEPGDLRAVRRPDRVPVGHTGAAREIAPRSLLGGHTEQLAAPFEERPLAGGRETGVAELGRRDGLPARAGPVHVTGHVDHKLA